MSSVTSGSDLSVGPGPQSPKPTLDQPVTIKTVLMYLAVVALGLAFVAWSIFRDIRRPARRSSPICLSCCWASPC